MQTAMGLALKQAGLVTEADEARVSVQLEQDTKEVEALAKECEAASMALSRAKRKLAEAKEAKAHAQKMFDNFSKQGVRGALVGHWKDAILSWTREERKQQKELEDAALECESISHRMDEIRQRI